MLPDCQVNVCQRKSSMWNYKWENAPMVIQSDTRTPQSHSLPTLRTSTYHTNRAVGTNCTGSSKVTRPHKKGAGEYEAKRIDEAKQKRAQQKARAKASPTELSFSGFSCSVCNRQFSAKTGLIIHLRTNKQ